MTSLLCITVLAIGNAMTFPQDPTKDESIRVSQPDEGLPPQPIEATMAPPKELPFLGSFSNPKIPGQPWLIHDATRPRPKLVEPGNAVGIAPADAIVLFDGTDLSAWCHRGQDDELFEPRWKVVDGALEITPGSGSLYTIDGYASCQLHVEWRIPEGVRGSSQSRGNSGIKLMERFEVQILDTRTNRTYADGQAGAIYGQYPPLVNASLPAGAWQTYDIFFLAPEFENEKLARPAQMTVLHNGILVQVHRSLPGPTGARLPTYSPLAPAAPIMLQDHGAPIRFRNIWIREVQQ